jgi:hypothetical protein
MDRWLSLFAGSKDRLEGLAAAHRLEAIAQRIPAERLSALLDADLAADRLCAVAGLITAGKARGVAPLVDKRVRRMLDTIAGEREREAVTRLTVALMDIDQRRGVRLAAVADTVFWTRRNREAEPGRFPWTMVYDRLIAEREPSDYDALLAAGGDDAKAAVHMLFSASLVRIFVASEVYPTELDPASRKRFRKLAEAEREAAWQVFCAGAAVQLHATDLLPWLLRIADGQGLLDRYMGYSHEEFGTISETDVGIVLRGIGYLARVARDAKSRDLSEPAIDHLHRR